MKCVKFTKAICFLTIVFLMSVQSGCDSAPRTATEKDSGSAQPMAMQMPTAPASEFEFETPVRLKAAGEFISVESPGYACPTMADVDGDGKLDLVVGQFNGGKMQFFKNIASTGSAPKFAKPEWIKSGDEAAEVPGVW